MITNTPAMSDGDLQEIMDRLAEPFEPTEIKWKPQMVKGDRAMAVAYIDARVVMDRLDAVFGPRNWQDSYSMMEGGCVHCRLSCRWDGEWIHREDVGSPSEQPDEGDRVKAAHSDALKRAAVKWGIGRYLYRLPTVWVDYDSRTRSIKPPALPDWALPTRTKSATPARPSPAARPATKPKAAPPAPVPVSETPKPVNLPADGKELLRRLTDYDARLAGKGVWPSGALLAHIKQAGVKAGHSADLTAWTGPAIELAVAETKAFEATCRAKASESGGDTGTPQS